MVNDVTNNEWVPCAQQTTSKYRLWDVTSIVCVFPEEVCPYANMVPLYPSSTSMKKSEILYIRDFFPLKQGIKGNKNILI